MHRAIKTVEIGCVGAPLSRSTPLVFSLFICNNSVCCLYNNTDETLQQVQKKSFQASLVYQYKGRISCVALISWLSGATANHPFLFYDDIFGTVFLSFFFFLPLPLLLHTNQIFIRGVSLRNVLLQLVTHLKFPGWNNLLSFPLKHSYQPYLLLHQNNIHRFHMLLNSSVLFYE